MNRFTRPIGPLLMLGLVAWLSGGLTTASADEGTIEWLRQQRLNQSARQGLQSTLPAPPAGIDPAEWLARQQAFRQRQAEQIRLQEQQRRELLIENHRRRLQSMDTDTVWRLRAQQQRLLESRQQQSIILRQSPEVPAQRYP